LRCAFAAGSKRRSAHANQKADRPKERLAGQNAKTACPAVFQSYRHGSNLFVHVKAKVEADFWKTGKNLLTEPIMPFLSPFPPLRLRRQTAIS
jgi:hypothetical protein